MDLTTKARVKEILEKTTTGLDALIDQFIVGVSAQIEKHLDRFAEEIERTEQHDVDPGQHVFLLRGFPVDAVAAFELKNDVTRDFASATLIDTDRFYLDRSPGVLTFDHFILVWGPGTLQVKYTGGLGTNTADAITNFPDIAHAADLQVAHLIERRHQLGLTSFSAEGGSVSKVVYEESFIPEALKALEHHRRLASTP